jgi:hypothetical protein
MIRDIYKDDDDDEVNDVNYDDRMMMQLKIMMTMKSIMIMLMI